MWSVRNSTFRDIAYGVTAYRSSGAWTVRGSVIRNGTTGVYAVNTSGAWEVHQSTITDNVDSGINATGAAPPGKATANYWGQAGGPTAGQCVGNVICPSSHPSGTTQAVFEAVTGQSGDAETLQRQDVIGAVSAYLSDQPINGESLTRQDVIDLVRWYLT